jgi:hypothetical protein
VRCILLDYRLFVIFAGRLIHRNLTHIINEGGLPESAAHGLLIELRLL